MGGEKAEIGGKCRCFPEVQSLWEETKTFGQRYGYKKTEGVDLPATIIT